MGTPRAFARMSCLYIARGSLRMHRGCKTPWFKAGVRFFIFWIILDFMGIIFSEFQPSVSKDTII
ncbi:hypothetical protein [Novacetimonas pomaceti]|uniref:hypothetical protein n=1 Tax=Novacetimonas pomaceti TaxID=2021998 RepID=UPI001403EFC5|nr:hypothetical protein [Novacetimonas pomaceti]MBV1832738.1 hypothetical protein [Novacetimonas pomaceti]